MRKLVYKDRLISVYEKSYRRSGSKSFVQIDERDAVVVVPLLDNGKIVLERQFRPAIGRWLYELPAGHVDSGEEYVKTARRELREETGYRAGRLKRLFTAYPAPGIITQRQVYFLAENLVSGDTELEDDERIKIFEYTLNELLRMIRGGRIIDNKTIAGILYYSEFVKRNG